MPILAFAAVLLAALTHATWNYFAKRAAGSRHFVWLYSVGSLVLYGPIVLWIALRVLLLAPMVARDTDGMMREAREYRLPVAAVSVLGPLGYILVLFAMRVAPIGHVAPARELATLAGSYFGAKLLKERMTPARVVGAVLIVVGVISLAITRPT